jgi:hypothetical protein
VTDARSSAFSLALYVILFFLFESMNEHASITRPGATCFRVRCLDHLNGVAARPEFSERALPDY